MKARLVIGLGNPYIDSDKIGIEVAETVARDPRFQENTDFVIGGTDLLHCAQELRGRELIILIDSASSSKTPGQVLVREHGAPDLSQAQAGAHHLSAVQALDLLRWADPQIARARCVWVLLTTTQLPN